MMSRLRRPLKWRSRAAAALALVAACCRPAVADWLTISGLEFKKCDEAMKANQAFSAPVAGTTAPIIDKETGRCLTVKSCLGSTDADLTKCTDACTLSGSHSVVVLDICGSAADGCSGKTQQWTAKVRKPPRWPRTWADFTLL